VKGGLWVVGVTLSKVNMGGIGGPGKVMMR